MVGDEEDLRRAGGEEESRVDVGVAGAGAEVERRVARGAHGLALAHVVAPLHGNRAEERVAGADAVVVEDDDVEGAPDLTGERDLAGGRSPHGGAGRGGVVEAAVPGAPRLGRGPEAVGNGRVDGRAVGRCGGVGGKGG